MARLAALLAIAAVPTLAAAQDGALIQQPVQGAPASRSSATTAGIVIQQVGQANRVVWDAAVVQVDARITQDGSGNVLELELGGSPQEPGAGAGLVVVAFQEGRDNEITGSLSGIQNSVSIRQIGSRHVASFAVAGSGNAVSIIQR